MRHLDPDDLPDRDPTAPLDEPPSLKDLWNDEREKLVAELADTMPEAEAERLADERADWINDRVADRYAHQVDAARDRMKYGDLRQ